ncbi:MAG: M20/M25/M40 family metallo-hydrolase, partial [Thermoplasmata archaeon]
MYETNSVNYGFLKRISLILTVFIIFSACSIPITADSPLGGGSGPEPLGGDPATIQEIISKVTEQDLEKYITDLQNFGTRYTYAPECNQSAQYIFDEFAIYPAITVESHYFVYNSQVMRNVIATLPGINASNNKVYLVAGHYDSYASGNPMTNAPGADDDASGTAVALEAAKILSEYKFEATIKFAAWSAEEVGLIGSQIWAQEAAESEMEIDAYLNFDMIGYDPNNENGLDIRYDSPSQWISNEMETINADYGIGLNITTIKGGGASDHMSFWQQGYQAVSCIEHDFNTPNYHTTTDTVDKLNMGFDKKVTQLGLATLAKLAGVLTPGVGAVYLDSPAYQPADTVGITL